MRSHWVKIGVAALGIACVLLAAFLESKRRSGLYWYEVQQDYSYSISPESASKVPLEVTPTGFTVPPLDENWDTALLPVNVVLKRAGRWFEPSVELRAGNRRSIQYFERGVQGRRFLVLHPGLIESGRVVTMSGSHLQWQEQHTELFLFSNPEVSRGRLLVIAPHPDDAEIAAFGLYSHHDSYVATVSAGNYVDGRYAHLEPARAAQDQLRGRARAWDSLVVPTWGGVAPERIVNFGYWNGSLEGLFERREEGEAAQSGPEQDPNLYRSGAVAELLGGRTARPSWSSLVDDLQVLLETVQPNVIVAPHPALDAAPDHRFTTVALLEALKRVSKDEAILLLYTNHHVLSEYYPFGPADTAMTMPPWFDEAEQFGGVFSYELDAHDRQDKLFALEAMHDLRAAPRAITGDDPFVRFAGQLMSALGDLRSNPFDTYSYYRRAVRTNELFFVYRPSDRSGLEHRTETDFRYR
jgi:LmbE family N-acetylglucosaminyl deacetylase